MKVYVYQFGDGELRYFEKKPLHGDYSQGWVFQGTQEQPDIKPEKKTVVKEARVADITYYSDYSYIGGYVQKDAKNIRIIYEVEE